MYQFGAFLQYVAGACFLVAIGVILFHLPNIPEFSELPPADKNVFTWAVAGIVVFGFLGWALQRASTERPSEDK